MPFIGNEIHLLILQVNRGKQTIMIDSDATLDTKLYWVLWIYL